MNEIEIKLRVKDLRPVREKLLGMDFALEAKDEERALFFDDDASGFSSRKITIRIKQGSDWANFTVKLKKEDENYKVAEEYETDISDVQAMEKALSTIGLMKVFEYSKEREHWTDGESSVELDTVPGVGSFVEIEGAPEKIEELVMKLGLSEAERDKRSYPDIIKNGS